MDKIFPFKLYTISNSSADNMGECISFRAVLLGSFNNVLLEREEISPKSLSFCFKKYIFLYRVSQIELSYFYAWKTDVGARASIFIITNLMTIPQL